MQTSKTNQNKTTARLLFLLAIFAPPLPIQHLLN